MISHESLKYTKETVEVITYDTGITDWVGIDSLYRNGSFRDKVIGRIDATYYLNTYFSPDIIAKYRHVFMKMAKGSITDPELFSGAIMRLLNEDPVFVESIHEIFYSCPHDVIFGYYLIQTIANVFISTEAMYRSFFRGRPEVVICVSDGYLYFSWADDKTGPLLPDKIKCEVLSYAKNWDGSFRYEQTDV